MYRTCARLFYFYCFVIAVTLIQTNNLMLLMSSCLMQLCHMLGILIPSVLSVTLSPFQLNKLILSYKLLSLHVYKSIFFLNLFFSLLEKRTIISPIFSLHMNAELYHLILGRREDVTIPLVPFSHQEQQPQGFPVSRPVLLHWN